MNGQEPRPLRVLYVMHTAAAGGCAGSLRLLVDNLPPGSVEPLVISPEGDAADRFRRAGVAVVPIFGVSMFQSIAGVPLRGVRLLELLRTVWHMRHGGVIRKAIREFRPDVVHLNERGMLQAARIAWKENVPVVMHARSVVDRETWWVRALGTSLARRYVRRVIAIDQSVRWSWREMERCEVLYNPLPSAPGRPGPGAGVDPGHEKDGTKRVTYLSGLLRFKGIWDLLEAARLLRHREDIVFAIAGGNSRPRKFHRSLTGRLARMMALASDVESEVREWIAREDMGRTVRLLGHVEDPQRLLASTDIMVFPSHLNGPGRAVFEAGVHGVPSIVTLVDRIEDIIEDGVTGLITPERDPRALADAVEKLADDATLRNELGDNARRKYVEQFDGPRGGRRMLEIYRSLLADDDGETKAKVASYSVGGGS